MTPPPEATTLCVWWGQGYGPALRGEMWAEVTDPRGGQRRNGHFIGELVRVRPGGERWPGRGRTCPKHTPLYRCCLFITCDTTDILTLQDPGMMMHEAFFQDQRFLTLLRTFKNNFLNFIFGFRGEGKEKERERTKDWLPPAQTRHSGMCPDLDLNHSPLVCGTMPNQLSCTSRGSFRGFKDIGRERFSGLSREIQFVTESGRKHCSLSPTGKSPKASYQKGFWAIHQGWKKQPCLTALRLLY